MCFRGDTDYRLTHMSQKHYPHVQVLNIALPDAYVEHGNVSVLRQTLGIDSDSVIRTMRMAWGPTGLEHECHGKSHITIDTERGKQHEGTTGCPACETRDWQIPERKAKAIIMSGIVYVDGQKEDKAGTTFEETANIEVQRSNPEICQPWRPEIREGNDSFRRRVKR